MTNAHSVEHQTQVKVKHRGSDTKCVPRSGEAHAAPLRLRHVSHSRFACVVRRYVAKVLSIGTECDLALLTVEDDAFWAGVTPIVFGKLPRLQDHCTVVGYPIGGDTLSVTAGVVSRIEMTAYAHSNCELLGVQIDAAINAGNSGGPVFDSRGLCVGVAFQSLKNDDAEGAWLPPDGARTCCVRGADLSFRPRARHWLRGACGARHPALSARL
jgi:hypothetical protein